MRLVYMGTPDFSVPPLRSIHAAGHHVALVVTQPDRPRGRGLVLEASPVKRAAVELGLEVFQPEKPNSEESVSRIASARPDTLVVVAYGAILRKPLLELAPEGAINVHASLLPKYRGMSPIQRAIWDGETETGVTTMYMDTGVDTGDMILMRKVAILPEDTGGDLHDRLSEAGARLLVETLEGIAAGTAPRTPQTGEATYAARLNKEDGWIDWSRDARRVHDQARALTPWPGATMFVDGKPVVVVKTRLADGGDAFEPGTIVGIFESAVRVACGSGAIDLLLVRPAGRGTMTGAEFARGRRLEPGVRLESR